MLRQSEYTLKLNSARAAALLAQAQAGFAAPAAQASCTCLHYDSI